MDTEEFNTLVAAALENLPTKFKKAIDNVDIVVEDWPTADIAKGRLLLGLYQGVPKTTWGRNQAVIIPDKITIFRMPILWISQNNVELIKRLVIDTVEHEIAHHFGISDERLEKIKR